ncbi:MAG: 50S ribosomal protein L15 [Magnetococcales bacterium]|nr:50S ribosomal protein L15 [Magnetococcales bacterium]MBF0415069.1 50S ribosomal protein L15 [Magnetococcales bacterium]MBF0419157.1 50S ribosomal protein L15 [Magnetococcales bacterium]MBF0434980.1 50S ribosomal protein L15 [Magnetococcales bacterium]
MKLNELPPRQADRKQAKRVARGIGCGTGKTAGRGVKGQKARAGGYHKVGFEGGQMPLQRRLPKAGFKNPFRKEYITVSVGDLEVFEANAEVRLEDMRKHGLIRKKMGDGLKLLADGELTKPLQIHVLKASKSAVAKVEAAGGKVHLTDVVNG